MIFRYTRRAVYQLRAEIEDEDGNKDAVEWQITAGTPLDGNLPPQIDHLGLDPYEFPYKIFRAGKGYQFESNFSDVDGNLIAYYLYLDDTILGERLRNSGTNSADLIRHCFFSIRGYLHFKSCCS